MRASSLILGAAFCAGWTLGQPGSLRAETTSKLCSQAPSAALAHIGDALTSGRDQAVLNVSLKDAAVLASCGRAADAVSLELIAADAYADVNQPAKRCELLRKAQQELKKLGDEGRAASVQAASAACETPK